MKDRQSTADSSRLPKAWVSEWPIREAVTTDGQTLSAEERQRASRFKFDRHRQAYLASHVGLRQALSQATGIAARDIAYEYGDFGKPRLATELGSSIRFNLSHSGEQAIAAATNGLEVGIDIERLPTPSSRKQDWSRNIAERCFHPAELAAIESQATQAEQVATFYHLWTRKEAVVKLLGKGLQMPLTEFQVSPNPTTAGWTTLPKENPLAIDRCWVESLSVSKGYVAAIACEQKVQVCNSALRAEGADKPFDL